MRKIALRVLKSLVAVGVALLWWFPVTDYIDKPHTYRIGVTLLLIVVVSAALHGTAFLRYHRMVVTIRREEIIGEAEPSDTLYATNQRFRYAVRLVETAWILGLGILTILIAFFPKVAFNPNYLRYVITYFIGTMVATAYLTYRDLRVLDALNNISENAPARLETIGNGGKRERPPRAQ